MNSPVILLYNLSELSGLVLLVAVFCTALVARNVIRATIWFNLLSAGILSTVSQVLLLRRQRGPEPGWAICFLQAILVYPLTVLCSLVGAALLLQVYLSMHFVRKSRTLSSKHVLWINVSPIFISLCVLILAFAVGAHNPSIVERDPSGMRCHIVPNLVPNITIGVSMIGGLMIMILEGLVVVKLYQQKGFYKETLTSSKLSPRVILRVCIFNVIMMIVMICGTSVWFIKSLDDPAKFRFSNLTLAILPVGEGFDIWNTKRYFGRLYVLAKTQTQEFSSCFEGLDSNLFVSIQSHSDMESHHK